MTDPHGADRPLALDAVLVMLNPTKGELWAQANLVVAAALLVELTRQGRLLVTGSGQKLEVSVRDPAPVGDELLDDALATIASGDQPRPVTKLVTVLPKSDRVLSRLVADGAVTEESQRRFGMIKVQRHHPTPASDRETLTGTLRGALLGTSSPDARSAMLLSVLDIGPDLRAGVPSDQRPEVLRRTLAIRESIGQGEAAIVATIDDIVGRADSIARNAIVN